MRTKLSLSPFKKWLRSVIVPAGPGVIIPGKWVMYEYYSEPHNELLHIEEELLKKENLYWEIVFEHKGLFKQNSNIPVKFLGDEKVGCWSYSGNYLTIKSEGHKEIFQFALVKGKLRLLKKDRTGRIVFFGFFKKQPV